mgnify:CR=1 FL=1
MADGKPLEGGPTSPFEPGNDLWEEEDAGQFKLNPQNVGDMMLDQGTPPPNDVHYVAAGGKGFRIKRASTLLQRLFRHNIPKTQPPEEEK